MKELFDPQRPHGPDHRQFAEFPKSGWGKVDDPNLKTPFSPTQALHGHLRKHGKTQVAKFINITSIDGVSVNPMETYSYATSKAGLIHMTRAGLRARGGK